MPMPQDSSVTSLEAWPPQSCHSRPGVYGGVRVYACVRLYGGVGAARAHATVWVHACMHVWVHTWMHVWVEAWACLIDGRDAST